MARDLANPMTLDEHRERYAANIVWRRTGQGEEPLWDIADLTEAELRVFSKRVRDAWNDPTLRRLGYNQPQVYKAILDTHGLNCPHPKPFRTPDPDRKEPYICQACVPFTEAQNGDNDGSWTFEPGSRLTPAQREVMRQQIINRAVEMWGKT
jgi:hypothetical protein